MKAIAALPLLLLLQDKPLFEERFEGKLSDGWAWVREDPASWKLEGGAIRIKAQPGTIFYKTNNAKNMLLRSSPAAGTESDPVAAEVSVASDPAANGEQAGLLLYVDDSNYVKLVREYDKPKDAEGKVAAVMLREAKGIPEPFQKKAEAPVRLRLVWAGPKVTGQYQGAAAKEWVTLATVEAPPGENPRFGLCSNGAPADADRWATLREFRILKLPTVK
jgi:regulation of enolase protein 1 (concanavalin A-like superfamily)